MAQFTWRESFTCRQGTSKGHKDVSDYLDVDAQAKGAMLDTLQPSATYSKSGASISAVGETRKSNDVALDTLAALLDGLFARVPEAIVLLDTDNRVLQVNREFTKLFGYAQEEACGRLINELVVPEELSAEADEYTRRGLRGENVDVETVRKHKDGTRVHVSIISGPVSIREGRSLNT